MRYIAILFVRFYRKFLSPLKGKPTCRFYPTCSLYAIRVLGDWGFIRGSALTLYRLVRCQPFCRGGYDFPPPYKRAPDRLSKDCIPPTRVLPFAPARPDAAVSDFPAHTTDRSKKGTETKGE
ncbi:MAG: membrane protein insertion efficiency factor YidD [Clostridia bacterium]|nr:membrane protein insertion efficiency factor YidD [Clostridia bacterium]